MNQSQARAAARTCGASPGAEALEDARRGAVADLGDQRAHLGHAARALQQLAVGQLVLLDPLEEGVEAVRQRLGRRQPGSGSVRRRTSSAACLERGDEQLLLAGEVVVEQRLRDAGLARDAGHRQLGVGVAGEQLGAQLEQLAAALVDRQARVGGLAPRGAPYSVRSCSSCAAVVASLVALAPAAGAPAASLRVDSPRTASVPRPRPAASTRRVVIAPRRGGRHARDQRPAVRPSRLRPAGGPASARSRPPDAAPA